VVKRKVANRAGEADCVEIPGWSVECKRVETPRYREWWAQAVAQAELTATAPILFFRASRQPWQAMVDLSNVNPNFMAGRYQIVLPLEAACQLIRDQLSVEAILKGEF
jgi:hypothetical protein